MRGFYLVFGFNLLLLIASFLEEDKINTVAESVREGVYIVYMGRANGAPRHDHPQLLSEVKKRNKDSVLHTYNKSFLGFAARLSDEEAESIAQTQGVVSVFPDKITQLHTTRSWYFLETLTPPFLINGSTIPPVSNFSGGADTIIGIIDSGIWPEHPSFNDELMGQIPQGWKGVCMPGENSTNSFKCNKKVIGARYYVDPKDRDFITSARDEYGHGTHVASTAAGVPVFGASYYGLAKGIARGGSPGSRISVYRICGAEGEGCLGSAILKAFDDAIDDGVDVISVSLGGHTDDLLSDPVAIGAFHAAEKGITVVCSAGNDGPSPGTLKNFVPWILTVGGSTIDRDLETNIVLGGRRKSIIKGGGISFSGLSKSPIYHLVDGITAGINRHDIAYNASNCIPGSLDNDKVKGKIVLCESNDEYYGTMDKFDMLKSQGAIGMIMIDNFDAEIPTEYGTSPVAAVNEEVGARIRSYINSSTSNAMATILPTRTVISNSKPAPVVPFFSSRGPPHIPNLIKPDVAAPGQAILAAWPPINDSSRAFPGKKLSLFNIISGTSMSCPHVSGLAAMVKSWHPTWSPSAIRSAIMTTATNTNNQRAPIATDNESRATPYDIGAGEITLFDPFFPGLVYEIEATDYVQFLCNMGYNASVIKSISSTVPSNFDCPCNSSPNLISDMNYPSIAISGLDANGSRTVTRTVTNVGEVHSTYTATLEVPAGVQVQVVPKILRFTKTVTKLSFQMTLRLTTLSKESLFGSIIWSNWNHSVRSPFVVSNA